MNIRSTPATYLNILNPLRKLFSKANNGVSTQLFSYNGKGACPRCKGKGVMITEMAFMDPIVQECELCHGKRYSQEALQYTYHGKDISEVLNLSINDTLEFFKDVPDIYKKVSLLHQVGLGYLNLSQSMTTDGDFKKGSSAPFSSEGMVTFGQAIRLGKMNTYSSDFQMLTGHQGKTFQYMFEHANDYQIGDRHSVDK